MPRKKGAPINTVSGGNKVIFSPLLTNYAPVVIIQSHTKKVTLEKWVKNGGRKPVVWEEGVEKKTPIDPMPMGVLRKRSFRGEHGGLTTRINSCKPDAKKKPLLTAC